MNGNSASPQNDNEPITPPPVAEASKPRKRRIAVWVFALIGGVVLVCMGLCVYAAGIAYGWWPGIPGVFTIEGPAPTPQPGSLQVNETFDGVYKWPSGQTQSVSIGESNGRLRVETRDASFVDIPFKSMSPTGEDYSIFMHGGDPNWLQLGNIDAEFDASVEQDKGMAKFGAACRYQDSKNFYVFMLWSNGSYSIGKLVNDQSAHIQDSKSPAIKTGTATNHIRIVCAGNQLSLSVNGTHLATVTDSTLSKGILALLAGAENAKSPDSVVSFDNLVIRAP